jgi:solute:Na+ symporter, SSS family
VVASLLAAYMSTMASQVNWGSSYVVNDFYKRFLNKKAPEKELVLVGRVCTLLLILCAGGAALLLQHALQVFNILLQVGAGTGLIFILRWFWWRINAYTEITGMIVSFLVAVYTEVIHVRLGHAPIPSHISLVIGVAITTTCWMIVTLLTKPSEDKKLRSFYRLVRPGGPGWQNVIERAAAEGDPIKETAKPGDLPMGIFCMVIGCFAVYSTIFAAGYYLYFQITPAIICTAVAVTATIILVKSWGKLEMK